MRGSTTVSSRTSSSSGSRSSGTVAEVWQASHRCAAPWFASFAHGCAQVEHRKRQASPSEPELSASSLKVVEITLETAERLDVVEWWLDPSGEHCLDLLERDGVSNR